MILGLSETDALKKALEINQRDAEHIKSDDGVLKLHCKIENLVICYTICDPDTVFQKMSSLESNPIVLKDEVYFLIKIFLIKFFVKKNHPERRLHGADILHYNYLHNKYCLKDYTTLEGIFTPCAIPMAFSKIEFNVRKDNPSLCHISDAFKDYKNFKKEYHPDMISLLPPEKKYGGFVKALIHYGEFNALSGDPLSKSFTCDYAFISFLLILYNSKIFSNETRLECFEEIGITETDCALWSQLFDQQYPAYKNIHKLFGQLA